MGILHGMDGGPMGAFPVKLDGKPVERTQWDCPYSYDEFVVYKTEKYEPTDSAVYSDRLWEWDPNKFRRAVAAVWPEQPRSQMFHGKKFKDLEKFLQLYMGEQVQLTAVTQGCNVGNGYPYWVFLYRRPANA